MKRILIACGMLLLLAIVALAQVPTNYTGLQWDEGTTVPGFCRAPGWFYKTDTSTTYMCDSTGHFTLTAGTPALVGSGNKIVGTPADGSSGTVALHSLTNSYLPFANRLQSMSSAAPILAIYMMGRNCDGSAFAGGSGSTLVDCSGNGNDATLGAGAAAPTVGTDGSLVFSGAQYVTLPAGVVGHVTGVYSILTTVQESYGLPNPLIGSGASGTGFNLRMGNNGINTDTHTSKQNWMTFLNRASYGLQEISGDKFDAFGLHSVGLSLQQVAVSDYMFMDGQLSQAWQKGSNVSGGIYFAQTDTPMYVGREPGYVEFFNGRIYMLVLMNDTGAALANTGPTAAQMQALETVARPIVNSYGNLTSASVQAQPLVYTAADLSNRLIVCCDSITEGVGGMTPWPLSAGFSALLTSSYEVLNLATAGWNSNQVQANSEVFLSNLNDRTAAKNVCVWFWGTNNMQSSNDSTADARSTANYVLTSAKLMHDAGCLTIIVGTISRTGTGVDATIGHYNAIMRAEWSSAADAFVDVALDPAWAAGGYANPSPLCGGADCYLVDGIHPTTAGGVELAGEIALAINSVGLQTAAQHSFTVMTATGAITPAMGDIQFIGATGQTLTFFSPLTASSQVRLLTNVDSTDTVLIAPPAGYTISGLASIAIPPGASVGIISSGTNLYLASPAPVLRGTTASIGGGALLAGACATGAVTITGAATTMSATASPSSGTDPTNGAALGVVWEARVSAANTVTVSICAPIAGTPAAATYNVRVIQP